MNWLRIQTGDSNSAVCIRFHGGRQDYYEP